MGGARASLLTSRTSVFKVVARQLSRPAFVQTLRPFLVYFTRVLSLAVLPGCLTGLSYRGVLSVWGNEVSSLLVSSSQLVLQSFLSGDFFEAQASGRLEENDGDRERDCSIFASLLVRSQEQETLLKYHLRRSVLQNAQFSSHESHVFSKYSDLLSVLFCNGH